MATVYGYCLRGQRFYVTQQGSRNQRVSFMAAYQGNDLIAPMMFEGYCNRAAFEAWLEQRLLQPSFKAGQIIVCDNASFHKGGLIQELVKQAECELLYLPSYSPDLNPIEHQWFVLKNRMCKRIQSGVPFRQVMDEAFL